MTTVLDGVNKRDGAFENRAHRANRGGDKIVNYAYVFEVFN